MCDDRPWVITAPWWRWPKLGAAGRDPRKTAPVIQKYDASDPVTPFVKDPQHTLAYGPEDVVQLVTNVDQGKPKLSLRGWQQTPDPAGTRKVFLPAHKRFYLVVCELHCDSRGLPSVTRDKVCETGFVVRRRSLSFAPEHAAEAKTLVDQIGSLTARIAQIDRGGDRLLKKRVQLSGGGVFGMQMGAAPPKPASAVPAKLLEQRKTLDAQLAAARAQLAQWKVKSGAVSIAEGWIADPDAENVGAWTTVEETPSALEEEVYPLTPLSADPRNPSHDAAGKTIWFGLLPAGSREVDTVGRPRFDDDTKYEIRCFVRRHCCHLPKTGERNDCPGELVWSAPTAPYQLAGFFDPVGTGNHPINIKMPDIPALAASVGPKLPVAMHFPPNSALNVGSDTDGKPQNNGTNVGFPQICFFSIPLITIVATFVLNLFLPIVVFLFGLWFLLGLKFCIPPSLSISGGVAADFSADLNLRIDAALSVDVTLIDNLGAELSLVLSPPKPGALDEKGFPLEADLPITKVAEGHYQPKDDTLGDKMADALDVDALKDLYTHVAKDRSAEVDATDITAGVAWVPRVERWEVGA